MLNLKHETLLKDHYIFIRPLFFVILTCRIKFKFFDFCQKKKYFFYWNWSNVNLQTVWIEFKFGAVLTYAEYETDMLSTLSTKCQCNWFWRVICQFYWYYTPEHCEASSKWPFASENVTLFEFYGKSQEIKWNIRD